MSESKVKRYDFDDLEEKFKSRFRMFIPIKAFVPIKMLIPVKKYNFTRDMILAVGDFNDKLERKHHE